MDTPPKKSRALWAFLAVLVVGFGGAVLLYYQSTLASLGPSVTPKVSPEKKRALALFTRLKEAQLLINEGRYAEAKKRIEAVQAESTDDRFKTECDLHIAHACRGLGEYDRSLALYGGVAEKSSDENKVARALTGAGLTHAAAGDLDRSVQVLNGVVDRYAESYPDAAGQALFALADVCRAAGRVAAMRAALSRIMDEFPGSEGTERDKAGRRIERAAAALAAAESESIQSLLSGGAQAQSSIPSGQTVSWSPDKGPYVIQEDLAVPADSVVRIEPGTVLRFGLNGGLRVMGRIEAVGTAEKPIVCRTVRERDDASWWHGFRFEMADGLEPSVLTQVRFISAESAVAAERGTVTVTECDIQQSILHGFLGTLAGKIVAKNCRITRGGYEGIRCENGGAVTVEGGRVAGQAMTGITVKTTPNVELQGVLVEKNGRDGVVFRDGATGRMRKCRIISNARAGLLCRGDSAPQVAQCEITGNEAEGVTCLTRSRPVIQATRIRQNQGGVRLHGSNAKLTTCEIRDNDAFGIWCKLASPEIHGSAITGNAEAGVWVLDGGQPRLAGNNLAGNKGLAVRNHSSHVIDARQNWWGSTDPAEIAKRIEDGQDNDTWGKVNFDPPLSSPPKRDE